MFFPERRVEDRHQEYGHTCSYSAGLAVFLVVEEHRVSSVNVQDRDGAFSRCSSFVSSCDSERLDWSSPPVGATGHSRDMGPTCEHVIGPKRGGPVASHIRFVRWLCLRQYRWTFAKPDGSVEKAKTACRMADKTLFEWFLENKALGGAGLGIDIEKLQTEWPTLQENREKKRPRLSRRRNGEEAKGRPSHSGRAILSRNSGLTINLSQKNATFAHVRSSKIKQLFVSGWCKFENWFSTPFLRSKMLRICERTSSAATMKVSLASRSGKISCSFVDKTFQRGAKRLQISRSSSDLDWRTFDVGTGNSKWTINFVGDSIICVSCHKVLTFVSCFECESG